MPSDFVPLVLDDGELLCLERQTVYGWRAGRAFENGTAWGVVTEGPATLVLGEDRFTLRAGAYFVAADAGSIEGGRGLLIVDRGPLGLRQVGGPIEATGRLRYIDGCTDTLLVCPARRGEPSLNHLHIPAGTDQSPHTHHSDRLGVIVRGAGHCRSGTRTALEPGMGWWIPAGTVHSFVTTDRSLDVVAWHPDSVFGPTDEVHPMISGTHLAAR